MQRMYRFTYSSHSYQDNAYSSSGLYHISMIISFMSHNFHLQLRPQLLQVLACFCGINVWVTFSMIFLFILIVKKIKVFSYSKIVLTLLFWRQVFIHLSPAHITLCNAPMSAMTVNDRFQLPFMLFFKHLAMNCLLAWKKWDCN